MTPAATATTPDPRLEPFYAFIRAAVSIAHPSCAQTLPAVVHTLNGIIQATEIAAQKVLDESERLSRHREQAVEALAALAPMMTFADPAAKAAWTQARQAVDALTEPALTIVSAMEFQDLTAQHLRATNEAVTALRERLVRLLAMVSVKVEADGAPVKVAEKLGAPAARATWRQEIADQLVDESREGTTEPRP